MKKAWIILLIALALAACGGQALQTTSAPTNTSIGSQGELPAPVQANPSPTTASIGQPTAQASETPLPSSSQSGLRTFHIVPGESQLQYEVGETFLNQNNRFNLAVGITTQITGDVQLDPAAPQNAVIGEISADISQFRSDSPRRDNTIRDRFLESSRFPIVTFKPAQIEGLPAVYQPGDEIAFKVSGDLTIRQVTKPVTFDVKAKLDGDTLSGQATTTILMSDFGFGPISMAGILNTEDAVKITFTFIARP